MDIVKFLTAVRDHNLDTPEVQKFIEENDDIKYTVEEGLSELSWHLEDGRYNATLDGIPLRQEHEEGGYEGAGEVYYVVFEYDGRFYRIDGWYNSWEGGDLDGDPYEVKKVPVEAFDYKPIKD